MKQLLTLSLAYGFVIATALGLEQGTEKTAQDFISLLNQKSFNAATEYFDANMRNAASPAKLQAMWNGQLQILGFFRKIKGTRTELVGPYRAVFVTCQFEKQRMDMKVVFDQANRISGLFCVPTQEVLDQTPADIGKDITISVKDGTLHGTLEIPSGVGPCPAVVIISGSGPTDRDGNNPLAGGKNNSLKLLAESLASHGIASVRYDKRGIGESAQAVTKEEDLRFETYIDDAVLWGKELQKDRRFTHMTIVGHSEGSLIGMVACQKLGGSAFVSIAGAGFPASQIILTQLKPKLPEPLFRDVTSIVDQLNQGQTVTTVPKALHSLFRASVQPYMISWFRYDPAKEVAKLQVPVLIVQGSTDIQISIDDAKTLLKSNKKAKLITISGMNHVLKKVSGNLLEQRSSYGDPDLPIAAGLVHEITAFVMSVEKKKQNQRIQ